MYVHTAHLIARPFFRMSREKENIELIPGFDQDVPCSEWMEHSGLISSLWKDISTFLIITFLYTAKINVYNFSSFVDSSSSTKYLGHFIYQPERFLG